MAEKEGTTAGQDSYGQAHAGVQEYLEPIDRFLRRRINVATSVKGVRTWECTVDGEGFTLEEILAESDKLVAELERRYPIEVSVG